MSREEQPNHALRRLVAAVCAVFILVVGAGVPLAIVAPVPRAAAEVVPAVSDDTEPARPVMPSFGSSAIGAVGIPGVLATAGSQRPRQMASITKVVTALVVLQAKPLSEGEAGPEIVFTGADEAILDEVIADGGTSEPVRAGWKVGERAALETMLIPSANNYAESLAVWAYGSVPEYLTAARAYLSAHGLHDTTVVDTNGLDAGDRSTPADLVALGRLAVADPVIAAIVSKPAANEPNVGDLLNTNKLLGRSGVDGIKTGTFTTGANLLFSAVVHVGQHRVRLIGVVLGAKTHDQLDARVPAMLKSIARGFHDLPLATSRSAFATYRMRWGGTARAVPARDASLLVWGRTAVQRKATVAAITGGRKGERVGTVTYRVGDRTVSVPLVLDRDVLAAPIWWRLTNPLR